MHTLKELIAAVDDELETLRRLEEQEDSSATAAATWAASLPLAVTPTTSRGWLRVSRTPVCACSRRSVVVALSPASSSRGTRGSRRTLDGACEAVV